MNRSPAFQLYCGDWLKDPLLRSVSFSARGLWIDLLCLMHEMTPRGYLKMPHGDAMTTLHIARMTGGSVDEVSGLIQELEANGVFSRETSSGAIFSRRMVRDERRINTLRINGRKGGNPSLRKPLDNQTPNQVVIQGSNQVANQDSNQEGGSSSSSSSSINTKTGVSKHARGEKPPIGMPEPVPLPDGLLQALADWKGSALAPASHDAPLLARLRAAMRGPPIGDRPVAGVLLDAVRCAASQAGWKRNAAYAARVVESVLEDWRANGIPEQEQPTGDGGGNRTGTQVQGRARRSAGFHAEREAGQL